MTSHRIGVNLRVSGNCDQGARKYMEDNHVIKFLKKDTDDYEFAYFGIFDGHGGPEASVFCRDNLLNEITKFDGFWTDDDDEVLTAIRKGFLDTHHAMWNVLDSWPKTVTGLPSTAGTTATIAIIKQGKLYTGHVGDSALVLGENDEYGSGPFPVQAICITKEHKPDDPDERLRIEDAGGEVINKSGVPRVVWSRPKTNHKGPVRRSTQIDQIPFLAVARSLGDLWSYDYYTETYVVSPDPDVAVLKLDPNKHRCLILASDGLWNMLTPEESVNMVMDLETQFEQKIINDPNVAVSFWSNPAERLVSRALNKWRSKALKADNTSCVVVLIDPLGPSKLTLLKRKRQELLSGGEITNCQINKMPRLPTELDQRGKSRNKNANCSLSDSHIRVTDDSIIQSAVEHMMRRSFIAGPKPEDSCNESVNDSVQYIPKALSRWNKTDVRQSNQSHLNRTNQSPTNSHKKSGSPVFTKLVIPNKPNYGVTSKGKHCTKNPCELTEEHVNEIKKPGETEESDSEPDRPIPQPPPCTPCSVKDLDRSNESDGENSSRSSANVTDKAFSLASDESIESPSSSFREGSHPPTPHSAPAKLSSTRSRRGHISKSAQRKLARSGRKLQPPSRSKTKLSASIVKSGIVSNSSVLTTTLENRNSVSSGEKVDITKAVEKAISAQSDKSPLKRVLNTSKSMNDVATPKDKREVTRTVSCTGLTPEMSFLLSKKTKSTYVSSAKSGDIASHLFHSFMAADMATAASSIQSRKELAMIVDDLNEADLSSIPSIDPLKQLNKTGPIKKHGSKRWGNFLRASKIGIDHMFHRKDHSSGPCKLATTSTGKLERSITKVVTSKSTSVSTSKLSDLNHHLPDITVSHLTDLTTLSALSAEDSVYDGDMTEAQHSILSAADLTSAHSMLEEGKVKNRKGFLQKTRVTLRRARKAAKKAFFPENHRLFNHKTSGAKRKSDEFLPTPDLKRRRQLEAK